jgi:hypothetical protein
MAHCATAKNSRCGCALFQIVFINFETVYNEQVFHKKPRLASSPYCPEKPNEVFGISLFLKEFSLFIPI